MNRHYFHHNLSSLLGLDNSRIITFVGGGGKTTLLNILGKEFAGQGIPTLLTTTTHIMKPDFLPDEAYIEKDDFELFTNTLTNVGQTHFPLAALGIPEKTIQNKTKWQGPSMDFAKKIADFTLKNQKTNLRILCEGDGSKRLPVKLPKDGEPVFFPETDTIIGIIGLSCLGNPFKETLFRYELLDKIFSADSIYNDFLQYRVAETSIITTEFLYWLCLSKKGLRKNITTQNFCIVLNQADMLDNESLKSVIDLQNSIKNNGISCFITSLKNEFMI